MLDASAFYAGIPFASQQRHRTTTMVFDEVRHIKSGFGGCEALVEVGRLAIMNPTDESVKRVKKAARDAGELENLTEADVSVIALCTEAPGRLITDDYAVSNVAKLMGLGVVSVMTDGTARTKKWEHYCPSCKKPIKAASRCNVCGSSPRRRPKFTA